MNAIAIETVENRAYRLRWYTLLVIGLSSMVISTNGTMMNVALPTIQAEFDATSNQLQWMVNIYLLIIGGLVLTFGTLGDRIGRAKFLRTGLLIFGLSNLIAIFSTSATHLIIARAFVALGAAMVFPSFLSIVTNVFPKEERGKAIGICAGCGALGITLGPIIAGTILQNLDWKWVFLVITFAVTLVLILSMFLVTDSRGAQPRRLDLPGNALFFMGMASLIYGLNNKTSHGWTDPVVLGPIIGSLAVLALFVPWERRAIEPLLNLSFFKNIQFSTSLVFLNIFSFGNLGVLFLLAFYIQFARGHEAFQTGLRYLPLAIGFLMGAVISVRLLDRLGRKAIIFVGFTGAAIMLLFAAFFSIDTPFWQVGTVLLCLGLSFGSIVAPATDLLMGSLPVEKAGTTSALSSISNYLPGAISIAALGSLLTSIYSSHFENAAASISGLPSALADKASDSIGAAVGIANSGQVTPEMANALTEAARNSFMDGWQIVAIVLCAIFAIGAVLSLRFIPRRNV